mmetsp:Transcript_33754/g.57676  ORF Transcript_33754/g.57676 Transcript_33754/m.57676 type:complete len:205 (-) Transcript_33754:1088-1702(-)
MRGTVEAGDPLTQTNESCTHDACDDSRLGSAPGVLRSPLARSNTQFACRRSVSVCLEPALTMAVSLTVVPIVSVSRRAWCTTTNSHDMTPTVATSQSTNRPQKSPTSSISSSPSESPAVPLPLPEAELAVASRLPSSAPEAVPQGTTGLNWEKRLSRAPSTLSTAIPHSIACATQAEARLVTQPPASGAIVSTRRRLQNLGSPR